MPYTTFIFDAYGTLLDVNAAAQKAAAEPEHAELAAHWPALSRDWRRKQLEYTWLRSVAGRYVDFWQITQDGLDWALEAQRLTSPQTRQRLLDLYWQLAAYPEVPEVLARLKAQGKSVAILSNGTAEMLQAAAASAGISDLLDDILTVEAVGIFKPSDTVYDLVGARFGTLPEDVLFVSSNGWDIAGAAGYGFQTAWVNRGKEPVDRLYAQPHRVLSDLISVPEIS